MCMQVARHRHHHEALQRIGETVCQSRQRSGAVQQNSVWRQETRAAPLMQSLYDWIQQQMKTLSRHSDTAKAFAYLLKQWDASERVLQ